MKVFNLPKSYHWYCAGGIAVQVHVFFQESKGIATLFMYYKFLLASYTSFVVNAIKVIYLISLDLRGV